MVKALSPTPERRHHGSIRRSTVIADSNGDIGRPWHCRSLLDTMLAKAEISGPEHQAGCQFQEIAAKAQIPALKAANLLRARGASARSTIDAASAAQRQIRLAIDALGGLNTPMGSLAWDVLGCDDTLSDWSRRQRWTGQSRQTAAAKGVLLSALPMLALHFGLTRQIITR